MTNNISIHHNDDQLYVVLVWFSLVMSPSALMMKKRLLEHGMEHKRRVVLTKQATSVTTRPSDFLRQLALYLHVTNNLDAMFKQIFLDVDRVNYTEEEINELDRNLRLLGVPGFL